MGYGDKPEPKTGRYSGRRWYELRDLLVCRDAEIDHLFERLGNKPPAGPVNLVVEYEGSIYAGLLREENKTLKKDAEAGKLNMELHQARTRRLQKILRTLRKSGASQRKANRTLQRDRESLKTDLQGRDYQIKTQRETIQTLRKEALCGRAGRLAQKNLDQAAKIHGYQMRIEELEFNLTDKATLLATEQTLNAVLWEKLNGVKRALNK